LDGESLAVSRNLVIAFEGERGSAAVFDGLSDALVGPRRNTVTRLGSEERIAAMLATVIEQCRSPGERSVLRRLLVRLLVSIEE
jgi:hypothetical protein